MINRIKALLTPTYNVVYAPERSVNDAPIQTYKVLGNPANAGKRSKAGNRFFTLPMAGSYEPRSFRADRVLGTSFAIW